MDFNTLSKLQGYELKKATFLINLASELGMDLESYGMVGLNESSGYVYIWLEDYNFALYFPIYCELKKEDVFALWSDSETGEEISLQLNDNTTLKDLETWAYDLEEKALKTRELETEIRQ